jgi:glycosyltransferase involved in cell wall biosynthesis
MKVAMHPGDKGGCGLYRMFMPARAVANLPGVEVSAHERMDAVRDPVSGRLTRLGSRPDADVVIFQRPMRQDVIDLIRLCQAAGVAVVVELDDDIERVDPLNQANSAVSPNPRINLGPRDVDGLFPAQHWGHLHTACRLADWLTVSTPPLVRYGNPGRVSVIRNQVPPSVLTLPHAGPGAGRPLRVGWSGTVATHPLDLQVTRGGVGRAVDAAAAEFVVVGDGVGVQGLLGLSAPPTVTGWVDIQNFPEAVTNSIDVGIVPLADTAFNRAKSYLKGLEFAALGIPFVASPLPEYERLAALGIGVLARRPRDWAREVGRLLSDVEYREGMAARGRAAVLEHHLTIDDATARLWLDAWTSAVEYRSGCLTLDLSAV